MAISLNNHETRIKKLEESGVSTWQKGSNSNGYWAKETTTGLIIQWGSIQMVGGTYQRDGSATFPIPFKLSNAAVATTDGQTMMSAITSLTLTTIKVNNNAKMSVNNSSTKMWWIAIGY